jgi:hypothetical protein
VSLRPGAVTARHRWGVDLALLARIVLPVAATVLVVVLVVVWCLRTPPAPSAEARARAAGHPSAPRILTLPERHQLARELAAGLTAAGLSLTRALEPRDVQVQANGEDGVYTLHVSREHIAVVYRTNAGPRDLGRFLSASRATLAVTSHAGLAPQH